MNDQFVTNRVKVASSPKLKALTTISKERARDTGSSLPSDSTAERLQRAHPEARVVKSLNTRATVLVTLG